MRKVFLFVVGIILFSGSVSAKVVTGKPNEDVDVTYSYDTDTRTLTVTGSGSTGYYWYGDLDIDGISLKELVTKIVISEGITRIEAWTFSWLDKLTEVQFPSTLKEIGYSSFKGCISMPAIIVPDNVVKVEDDAFCDWDGATSLIIGKSLSEFGTVAFAACDGLRSITIDSENKWFETRGCNGIFKPGNDTLFLGICTTVIPEGIHYIGKDAYIRNLSVESVCFPSTLKEVGDHAFSENYNLTSVAFADSIETICDFAFWHCEALKFDTLYLPKMLRILGGESFGYGPKSRHVECGDSLRYIGVCPFDLNDDFESINVGNHLEEIQYGAFWSDKLKSIYLPPTLKVLGINAFDAPNLERIDIDDIDAWCHIRMGNSGANPASTGRIYLKGEPITRIVVPDDIIDLSTGIFRGFTDLKEVILPYGLRTVGEGAFSLCTSLEEVRFPPTVCELDESLFGGTPNIRKVYLYNRIPGNCRYGTYVFDLYAEKYEYPEIYVPEGCIQAYLSMPEYSEAVEKGMVIKEFDMAGESPLAPALPKHLYMLRGGDEILEAREFSKSPEGIYTITSEFSEGGSFRFIQDQIDDWYVINYRDYFPVVEEWGNYTGGTYTLDNDDHGCWLEPGFYDFEVNMRTMMCTITPNAELNNGVGSLRVSPARKSAVKQLRNGRLIIQSEDKTINAAGLEYK
ncbi:MAG: leucine-rich repeat domain-containing protein [Bacteroidaceae bacterium]|nr:leucine-rich repeat domain-containing protein [Bacteroidaceae bacterium]